MSEQATVTLTHPDTDQRTEVNASQVDLYRSQGWREATLDAPAGNASLEAWQDFARAKNFTPEEIEGKSRDELRAALS